MSTPRLTPLSYVVLGLIGRDGASPHEIVDMVRRGGRLYWAAAPSKVYAEPKRLEQLGLVRSTKAPGRTRERTVYRLTAPGRAALREWARTPATVQRTYSEAAVRVLCGDEIGDEAVLVGLKPMREEIEQWRERIAEAEVVAGGIPHRTRYLILVHALGRMMLDAQERWLDLVERELG